MSCKFLAVIREWDFFFSEEADFKCHVSSVFLRDLMGAVVSQQFIKVGSGIRSISIFWEPVRNASLWNPLQDY